MGVGVTPNSWQGWVIMLLGVTIEIAVLFIAHAIQPSWFKPKTHGSGFTAVAWQGWLVTLGPILVFILAIYVIYLKQAKLTNSDA
jgi:hypothetical protein